MRCIFILTLALVGYISGAPTDLDIQISTQIKTDEDKSNYSDGSEDSSNTIDWNNEFWIETTPLPPIVTLPEPDKKILCEFLDSFQIIRVKHFLVIMAANMEFMSNAEKHFPSEFREEMAKPRNTTYGQEYFGIDPYPANIIFQNKTAYEEYAKVDVVKANTLKMLNTISHGIQIIHKQLLDVAQKVKSSLSKETVKSEWEFLVSFENIKTPTYFHNDSIADLLNDLQTRIKHKYQCS